MPTVFSGKRDVYLEVADRYEKFIRLGILKEGDKLPSVRTAASELSVNPNTVQKAYNLLERKGLICALPKKGAFVRFSNENNYTSPSLLQEMYDTVAAFKDRGVSQNELVEVIKEVYNND